MTPLDQRTVPSIAERVAELVAAAPPLTAEQISGCARIVVAAVKR